MSLPKGVTPVKSKGKTYWYWRPNRKAAQQGKEKLISVRLPKGPDSQIFWEKLKELGLTHFETLHVVDKPKGKIDNFSELIKHYQSDIAFRQLAPKTQKEYKRYHKIFLDMWADIQVSKLKPKHVLALRNKFSDKPYKANYMLRTLSALMSWSVPRDYRNDNPCAHVKLLKTGDGWEPWTWDQILYFKEYAQPHIWHVVAICLYTGQRITDVLKVKWTDISEGMIRIQQEKTKKPLYIPIHDNLKPIIDGIPKMSIYILTNSRGVPWKSGWNAALQKQLAKPEMEPLQNERLTTHGLRKSACCFLAECDCTDAEIQAITGHSKAMVEHYRKRVNQKKLAKNAILKFSYMGKCNSK